MQVQRAFTHLPGTILHHAYAQLPLSILPRPGISSYARSCVLYVREQERNFSASSYPSFLLVFIIFRSSVAPDSPRASIRTSSVDYFGGRNSRNKRKGGKISLSRGGTTLSSCRGRVTNGELAEKEVTRARCRANALNRACYRRRVIYRTWCRYRREGVSRIEPRSAARDASEQ